ncbi:hypothetical protein SODG_000599 [Sodalis praecaptivus]
MEKFDRQKQHDLLNFLFDLHPLEPEHTHHQQMVALFGDELSLASNLIYLEEHQLVTQSIDISRNEPFFSLNKLRITAKGIDFLANDGGLGAILNVQTIRLHNETLVALEDIIRVANMPESEKKGLIAKLRELPADAIKHLILQLLTRGF